MGGNLRNWVHFLKLRLDEHAQYEVRVIAQRIQKQLQIMWPNSLEALM
jgi:thymidylate synthase ThyX